MPPGWYADPWPGPPDALRWWDGQQWTSHTSLPSGRPAGWGRRALAYLVDSIALGIVASVVTFPAQRDFNADVEQAQAQLLRQVDAGAPLELDRFWWAIGQAWSEHWFWLGVVPALLGLAYHVIMLRTQGATLGKMALKLEVAPATTGTRLSTTAILVRVGATFGPAWVLFPWAFSQGSLATLALVGVALFAWQAIDVLWAAGPNRRAVHDLLAGTRVIRR